MLNGYEHAGRTLFLIVAHPFSSVAGWIWGAKKAQ
jgi:hypothetical protein